MAGQRMGSAAYARALFALFILLTAAGQTYALPSYARRLGGVSCGLCHQPVYPRLNKTGWEFRRLGYRLPSEIGKSLLPGLPPAAAVAPAPAEAATAGLDAAKVTRGQQVYASSNCASCHSIGGSGGKVGPDLSNEGSAHNRAWLTSFLRNPGSMMPAFQGSQADLDALVEYMLALKPGSGQGPSASSAGCPSPGDSIIHYNYADTLSALFISRYDHISQDQAHTFSQFYLNEVGAFLTGPALANWGYFIHTTFLSHEPEFDEDLQRFVISPSEFEVESAELRYAVGARDHYFSAKLGQFTFGGIDGFMSDDLPVTTNEPLMFSTAVNGFSQDATQQGIDLGYTLRNDHFSALVLNGLNAEGEGTLSRPISSPDWALQWIHWIGRCGSSAQILYYNGRTPLDDNGDVVDNFYRLYFLGNWQHPLGCDAINLLGGYMTGNHKKAFEGTPPTVGRIFDLHSFFVEADYEFSSRLVPYLRYDAFHTDESELGELFPGNPPGSTSSWTVGAAYQPNQAIRFNLEAVPLSENPGPDQTTVRAQIWFMW